MNFKIFQLDTNKNLHETLFEMDGTNPEKFYPFVLREPRWMNEGSNLFNSQEEAYDFLGEYADVDYTGAEYVVLPYYQTPFD